MDAENSSSSSSSESYASCGALEEEEEGDARSSSEAVVEDETVVSESCSLPKHHWSNKTEKFKVRSETYLTDKKKVICDQAMFNLIGMDLIEVDQPVNDLAKNLPGGFAQRYLEREGPKPFLFTVHFQLPGNKNLAFIAYFAAKTGVLEASTPFAALFDKFINGSDEFRQSRFKFIPRVGKGPVLLKTMVGTTPAILGNKLRQTYYSREGYFEVCVDVGSSCIGGRLLKLVKGCLTTLAFEMCFLLEGQTEAELPEVCLGNLRFVNLDLNMAQKVEITEGVAVDRNQKVAVADEEKLENEQPAEVRQEPA